MQDMTGYTPNLPGAYLWADIPGMYHNKACGFSFADGHSEIHRWRDPTTMPPLAPGVLSGGKGSGTTWLAPRSVDVAWMQNVTVRPLQ
jgi:prepilin-type processing-associated H-X9-DG protein